MRVSKKIKNLALCSVLAAFGVVILMLGSFIEALDLSAATIASLLVVVAVLEAKGFWPWLTYAVTATVALLLLPTKTAAIMYLFFGYYPIVKSKLEKLPKVFSYILKFIVFNVSLVAVFLVFELLFTGISVELVPGIGKNITYLIYCALGNVIFMLYDILITRLVSLYIFKLRDRIGFGRKK